MNKKIVSLARLKKILKSRKNKKIVFTNGCFDILHYGHVKYLNDAKNKGHILIVGINSDTSVKRLKGLKRPINNQKDRAEVIAALACVDYCVIFSTDTPLQLIKIIKPDILVKGGDWAKEKIVGSSIVLSYRGKVLTIPFVKGRSTTSTINKIINL